MSDQFVAEIRIFPFVFAPKGWAFCNGQLYPISQNTALFALLGTVYGGDGKSTFALPDLRGAVPIQVNDGSAPGLSTYDLGQAGGADTTTLLTSEIPVHSHELRASLADSDGQSPESAMLATGIGLGMYGPPVSTTLLAPQATGVSGGDVPHNNLMPYLTLNFCIALQGVFPST